MKKRFCSLEFFYAVTIMIGFTASLIVGLVYPFRPGDRDVFTEELNRIRREVDPPTSNMEEIKWNEQLATVAGNEAEQCLHSSNQSLTNQSAEYTFGELRYVRSLKPDQSSASFLLSALSSWYETRSTFPNACSPCNRSQDSPCSYNEYSQVISHNARNIGCGATLCTSDEDGTQVISLVCNLWPSGCATGEWPYTRGTPCSACPNGTYCNNKLCTTLSQNLTDELKLCEATHSTHLFNGPPSEGVEFYLTFWSRFHTLLVYITTSEDSSIPYTIYDASTGLTKYYTIKAGDGPTHRFEHDNFVLEDVHVYRSKGIIIKSPSESLSVFGEYLLSNDLVANDGFLTLPKPKPSTSANEEYSYLVIGDSDSPAMAVAATTNCTLVTITTVQELGFGSLNLESGSSIDFVLQEGETLVINSLFDDAQLHGMIITANHPISVSSGSQCFNKGIGLDQDCYHLVEQIPPLHEWGTQFAVSPIQNTQEYNSMIHVISSKNDTLITINCSSNQGVLNLERIVHKGKLFELTLSQTSYCWIESDEGVLVIQYFDPVKKIFMMIVPPIQQYSNRFALPAVESRLFGTDYINVHIPLEYYQPDQIFIDGMSFEEHKLKFTPIVNSSGDTVVYATYISFSTQSVKFHYLYHSDDLARLGVQLYGLHYGYPGALHAPPTHYHRSTEGGMSLEDVVIGTTVPLVLFIIILISGITSLVFITRHHKKKSKRHRCEPMVTFVNRESEVGLYPIESACMIVDRWEVSRTSFQIEKEIGSGNYGFVHRGTFKTIAATGNIKSCQRSMMSREKSLILVAIKTMKVTTISERNAFLSEIEMMKKVSEGYNSHVVKMVGCVTLSSPMALLLEYVPHGNLRDYLRNCTPSVYVRKSSMAVCIDQDYAKFTLGSVVAQHILSDADLISFCYQIACGMEYLSSLNIIHRDLACRNVLVDDNNVLKISDFGLARKSEAYVSRMKDKLPLRWMAPETCNEGLFTEHSDVWAYGISLWEIFTYGDVPYSHLPNAVIIPRIFSGYRLTRPEICEEEVYFIMKSCWDAVPSNRPSFRELRVKFESIISESVESDYTDLLSSPLLNVNCLNYN